jgi:hypothetical protein
MGANTLGIENDFYFANRPYENAQNTDERRFWSHRPCATRHSTTAP